MRVLIVDPDAIGGRKATQYLSAVPNVKIVGRVRDLTEAFNFVEHRPPNLVLIDQRLTVSDDFEVMETLFRCLSVRYLPYTPLRHGASATIKQGGRPNGWALDLAVEPPTLARQIRQSPAKPKAPSAAAGVFQMARGEASDQIVLIGSSTGGVDALIKVLDSFPVDCPPTLIVQHTGASFSAGLARLLNQRVEPVVREAVDGERPERGTVLLAPSGDQHLTLEGRRNLVCRLDKSPAIRRHRPSVDALFDSAVPCAERVIGVILTGMGQDGAQGLLNLRQAGARTIGQDKATSLVYGMPGAAAKIGAVEQVLPLNAIGTAILRNIQRTRAA